MSVLNPFFAIIIYVIAFLTAYILQAKNKITTATARFQGIDSLRGFLALGVFIHHASIWHQYIQTGSWDAPKSNFYNHLGQTSVSFFFMITSFLFITKLLNANTKPFNWRTFFISRFFRLAPMYYFSIALLVLCVLISSHFILNVSAFQFFKSVAHWGIFTIVQTPDINNQPLTNLINAKVVWSLPFEWLFYFSLPLIALFLVKTKPSPFYIILSTLFVVGFFFVYRPNLYHHLLSFACGAIAPFLIKYVSPKIQANNFLSSVIILLCLFLITQFATSNNLICKALIAIVFILIALGNTMFGLFKSATLQFLGEICYSTYLLHGIILFTVMYFGFGIQTAKQFTPTQYCVIIFLITPLLVILSFLGYKFIEKPFMDKSKKITDALAQKK